MRFASLSLWNHCKQLSYFILEKYVRGVHVSIAKFCRWKPFNSSKSRHHSSIFFNSISFHIPATGNGKILNVTRMWCMELKYRNPHILLSYLIFDTLRVCNSVTSWFKLQGSDFKSQCKEEKALYSELFIFPRVKFKRLPCKLSGEMKATVAKYWCQLSLNSNLIIILYCLELILF